MAQEYNSAPRSNVRALRDRLCSFAHKISEAGGRDQEQGNEHSEEAFHISSILCDMSLREKARHLRPSWRAIVHLWKEEFSFRAQVCCAAAVLLASWVFHISETELLIIVLLIGAIFAVEALNTAIEELCDHVTPEKHPHIGKIKDLGSGASLLMGIAAVAIGLIIFIPHIFSL
jgi:diacylglycerol kinase (ATP)